MALPTSALGLCRSLLAGAAVCVAAGCAMEDRLVLVQTDAPPAQRRIELAGGSGAVRQEGGAALCALGFPLPGARAGPPAFRVFVEAPDSSVPVEVGASGAAARGFLIQEVGLRKGKAMFQQGLVSLRPIPLVPGRYTLSLDVLCDDQTSVRGRVIVRRDDRAVGEFCRQFSADVAAACGVSAATAADSQPAEPDTVQLTESRGEKSPKPAAEEPDTMGPRFLEPPPPP